MTFFVTGTAQYAEHFKLSHGEFLMGIEATDDVHTRAVSYAHVVCDEIVKTVQFCSKNISIVPCNLHRNGDTNLQFIIPNPLPNQHETKPYSASLSARLFTIQLTPIIK